MWPNAQRDGRPAEHRWRPLFNAEKFGWRPLLECRAVTLPGRETRWNLQGCPKLANRSQPLVIKPKFTILSEHAEEVLVFNKFFSIVDICLSSEDIARQVVRWCQNGYFFASCISASRVQQISDMHSKFALWPHHVWKYSPTAEIRRGKKKERKKERRRRTNHSMKI